MEDDDADTVLMLVEAFEQQDSDVCDEVFHVVVKEPWKIAMRSGHYLTLQFLDSPSYSAWMMLYTYGNDINFLDATSLTRCDPTCCCRATALLTRVCVQVVFQPSSAQIPSLLLHPTPHRTRTPAQASLPSPGAGLVMSFYVGSMEQSTLHGVWGPPHALEDT
ncbi:hypothetical protein PI126_g9461 [Phytophthora idaei]|nr:hypothetical protein PI126_g9461 [Phytophthora idaei]